MGYIRHHAIVVSGWDSAHAVVAQKKATSLFKWVSPVSPAHTNGYCSFFVPPDGSKEGWNTSTEGDENRKAFINWLRDNDRYLDWVEVQYGDDEGFSTVLAHSDDNWTPLEEIEEA